MLIQKPMLGELPDASQFPMPVALWLFNEGAGSIVNDLSGNNPAGTKYGTTIWTPGKFGPALDFLHTSGNYVNTNAKQSVIDLPTTYNFTVVFWAAATNLVQDNVAISFEGADDLLIYPYATIGNGFRVYWRDLGGSIITVAHSLAGTGYHQFVFVSYASNDHRAFIDGEQKSAVSDAGTAGPFSNFYIGSMTPTSQNFHGQIDNVAIFNFALTAQQIAQLYIDPFPWFKRDPIELWAAAMAGAPPVVVASPYYYEHLMQGVA